MSQENISFSNQTKALQAILRKRKQRTTDSGSETEPFPFGNDSQKAEKSAGLSLFSEEFLKEPELQADDDGIETISEDVITEAFLNAAIGSAEGEEADGKSLLTDDPEDVPLDWAEEIADDTEKEAFRIAAEELLAEEPLAAAEEIIEEYAAKTVSEIEESVSQIMEDAEKDAVRIAAEESLEEALISEIGEIEEEYSGEDAPYIEDAFEEIGEDTEEEPLDIEEETAGEEDLSLETDEITEECSDEDVPETEESYDTSGEDAPEEFDLTGYEADEPAEPMTESQDSDALAEDIPAYKRSLSQESHNSGVSESVSDSVIDLLFDDSPAGKKTEKDLIREKAADFCARVRSGIAAEMKEKELPAGSGVDALFSADLNSMMKEGLFVRFLKTKNQIGWDDETPEGYHTVKDDKNYADELIVSIAECLRDFGMDSKFYYMYSDYNHSDDSVKNFGLYEKGYLMDENHLRAIFPKASKFAAAEPGEALLLPSDNQYGYQKTKLLVVVSANVTEADNGDGLRNKESEQRDAGRSDGRRVREFTAFCASLLKKNGYENVAVLPEAGGHGIDLIAVRDKVRFAVQCRCDSLPVDCSAIREAAAGRNYHGAHVGIVMTDGSFAEDAREPAKRSGVVLWDGAFIAKLEQSAY